MQKSQHAIVTVRSGHVNLTGDLMVPPNHLGLVIFSHGSGSSRNSPRNRFVAEILQQKRFATFLVDLLTEEEDRLEKNRFDISLLTSRLTEVIQYFISTHEQRFDRIGLFGASTGAASALRAAAAVGQQVFAVVSRGGRPDLAWQVLEKLQCPVLLIVGGADLQVLNLNKRALMLLHGEKRLHVVPEATHLFEEPGALEAVANVAADWFFDHVHQYQLYEVSK